MNSLLASHSHVLNFDRSPLKQESQDRLRKKTRKGTRRSPRANGRLGSFWKELFDFNSCNEVDGKST